MKIFLKIPKDGVLFFWRKVVWLVVKISYNNKNQTTENFKARLFYAGAISGDRGGPRVKVARLKEVYPQKYLGYNLVYVLSNYPYISRQSLESLKKKNIPIILNQNGVYMPGWYGQGWQEKNIRNADIYSMCDYVFWQSQFAKKASRHFLSDLDPIGEILYNSVNLNIFHPRKEKNRVKDIQFLMAGKFSSSKSYYQIEAGLKAFSLLPKNLNCQLTIAGLDRYSMRRSRLLADTLNLSSKVKLIGPYRQKDFPSFLRNFDVYLALKYQDTCPNLVIESLASGLAVIYSDSGGTPELVSETCGIGLHVHEDWNKSARAPNPSSISGAMTKIIESMQNMKSSAREHAEIYFDIKNWYLRHEEVFENLLFKIKGAK